MPRPPRVELPGIPLHVIQRGVNRMPCFFSDIDRRFYLKCLAKYASRRRCAIHAYVLMTNHVHLLITPDTEASCGFLMKHVGQLYSQYFNKVYRRTGALWEGRFRSCVVQNERYLLTCYCYIELNPVRAALVAHPAEYRWSSYQDNVSGDPHGFITAHPEYRRLGADGAERSRAYASLIGGQSDCLAIEAIRAATNGGPSAVEQGQARLCPGSVPGLSLF